MASVALSLAAEELIATHLLSAQRGGGAVGQIGVEFRRERANAGRDFVGRNRLPEFVEGLVGPSAVGGAKGQGSRVGSERRGAFWRTAHGGHIGGPGNIQ